MRQVEVFRAVAADPLLRRLETAFLLFSLAEFGTWLAITVWAFGRGGVREAGVAAFAQLVPAALVAPTLAYAGDRFRRDRVLALGMVAVAAGAGATGVAMLLEAPWLVVYVLAGLTAVSTTAARPAVGAILPAVTEDPRTLTAANVCVGLIENIGLFGGPAIAGLVLGQASPGIAFVVFGVLAALGAGLVVSIRYEPARVRPTGGVGVGNLAAELRSGVRRVTDDPAVRAPLAMATGGYALAGALDVFFVAIALELLDGDDALAGLLGSLYGIGGIVGALASIALIGAARLRPAIALAVGVAALAIALPALAPTLVASVAAVCAVGAGLAALDVACRTLIQRSSAEDVLARSLGVLESGQQFGVAIGALGVGIVADLVGIRTTLIAAGVLLLGTLALALRGLRRADENSVMADPAHVSLLRSLPMFAPLGSVTIEQLALNLRPVRAEAGDDIVRQGDRGDRFYIVADGSVEVVQDGRRVRVMAEGEAFGEIALLREVPRTATVRALEGTSLLALGRTVFLEAVTGQPQALAGANAATDGWLDADERRRSGES